MVGLKKKSSTFQHIYIKYRNLAATSFFYDTPLRMLSFNNQND